MNRFSKPGKEGTSVSIATLNALYHKTHPFPVIPPGSKNVLAGKRFQPPAVDTPEWKEGVRRNVAAYQPTNRPWLKDVNTIHGSRAGSRAKQQKQQ